MFLKTYGTHTVCLCSEINNDQKSGTVGMWNKASSAFASRVMSWINLSETRRNLQISAGPLSEYSARSIRTFAGRVSRRTSFLPATLTVATGLATEWTPLRFIYHHRSRVQILDLEVGYPDLCCSEDFLQSLQVNADTVSYGKLRPQISSKEIIPVFGFV